MRVIKYHCPICNNSYPDYFGSIRGTPYCRKCILYRGEEINSCSENINNSIIYAPYLLNYDLSEDQKRLSNGLLKNYKAHENSLVHAVCGSGKTEIVLKVISYAISCGHHVGFAVPRRDVAIELFDRFRYIFKENDITLVYGGHTDNLFAQLICCTTHQLYRYQNYFDLLILDEVDAFPFKGDDVLNAFFHRAVRGNFILMSATPSYELVHDFASKGGHVLELYARFHKYPLPVPVISIHKEPFLKIALLRLIKTFIKAKKQIFIFAPTINECEDLYAFIKTFFKNGNYVHSKRKDREEIIYNFKRKKYWFLVTTAVLERGITVKDLQVIVYHADNRIYDRYSLTQIAGRVGRKKNAPEGEVIYLANTLTKEMSESINDIKSANKNLQNLFKSNKN